MLKEDAVFCSIILSITTLPSTGDKDFFWWGGILLSIIFGAGMRVYADMKNEKFTWGGFGKQLLVTGPVCWVAYYVYLQWELTIYLQIYMTLISFSAVILASLLDKVITYGWAAVAEFAMEYIRKQVSKKIEDRKEGELK